MTDQYKLDDLSNKKLKPLINDTLSAIRQSNSTIAQQYRINIESTNNDPSISIQFPSYAKNIDEGRRSDSKAPPINAILQWIKDKKINNNSTKSQSGAFKANTDKDTEPITDEQLAFIIAKSIGQNGIKSRPFLNELTKDAQSLITNHLKEQLIKNVKDTLTKK